MWYFSWILGTGFAATLAIMSAFWFEIKTMGATTSPDMDESL